MKELKFRAWHKEKKEMGEIHTLDLWNDNDYVYVKADSTMRSWNSEDIERMQFTGLQDKNGVDIYEGDVVMIQYFIGDTKITTQVIWDSDIHAFRFYVDGDKLKRGFKKSNSHLYEVIGNIYENPELLEV